MRTYVDFVNLYFKKYEDTVTRAIEAKIPTPTPKPIL